MGITSISLGILERVTGWPQEEWTGKKMAELGNQFLYLDDPAIPHLTVAKGLFVGRGVDHTSFDLNGQDGALPKDLSKPITGHAGKYDIVTNYGVAEHVDDVYECLANIDRFCRVGGLMVHAWPKTGNWPGHGLHYASIEMFTALAAIAGYRVKLLEEHPAMGNHRDGWEVHCAMIKIRAAGRFPGRERFKAKVVVHKE